MKKIPSLVLPIQVNVSGISYEYPCEYPIAKPLKTKDIANVMIQGLSFILTTRRPIIRPHNTDTKTAINTAGRIGNPNLVINVPITTVDKAPQAPIPRFMSPITIKINWEAPINA